MRPLGVITRGTTAPGRLRRIDRWITATHPALFSRPGLLVVDLGFGASPVTTAELAAHLRRHAAGVRVIGLDLDPARVSRAQRAAEPGLEFAVGGFELDGHRPRLVRAANVLRQYDESAVAGAWSAMTGRLAPGGLVVEGTCAETGRAGSWICLDRDGPRTLTLAVDLTGQPSAVAARLPKALIHRNVPGEPVHDLLMELDAAWDAHAGLGTFSPRQRFAAAAADLRRAGWPVLDGRRRWRRGELTVNWTAVAPAGR